MQWYELNPDLLADEKELMRMSFPDSVLGKLDDGRLYWMVTFRTITSPVSPGCTRGWKVMIVYNPDHPNVSGSRTTGAHNYTDNYGGSVKVYPLSPDVKQMEALYTQHGRGSLPHILYDEFENKYLCIEHNSMVQSGARRGDRVTSAADYAAQTARWLTAFELSLVDDDVYNKFRQHTNNN